MKKFLGAALAAALLFGLVSCGEVDTGTSSSSGSTRKSITNSENTGVFGLLTGAVIDSYTLAPIEGVTVAIANNVNNWSSKTGKDGTFSFENLIPGEYTVVYHKDGYTSTNQTITVKASQYKEDDPFAEYEVLGDLLGKWAEYLASDNPNWSTTVITNGSSTDSSNSSYTETTTNGSETLVDEYTRKNEGKLVETRNNIFTTKQQLNEFIYEYGITASAVKLTPIGAAVTGVVKYYTTYGNTKSGYSTEKSEATRKPAAGVEVYAYEVRHTYDDTGALVSTERKYWPDSKVITDENGSFTIYDLPVGTRMGIGITAFDKEVSGYKYTFENENLTWSAGSYNEGEKVEFYTLSQTAYKTEKDGTVNVTNDNVLDLYEIEVVGTTQKPYIVTTNGYTSSEANPFVGTGFLEPLSSVQDAITVTFNMEMDPREFMAFYDDKEMEAAATKKDENGADVVNGQYYAGKEQMLATWSSDKKTVSLKRADKAFNYDATAYDAVRTPSGHIAFANAYSVAGSVSDFVDISIYAPKALALKEYTFVNAEDTSRAIADYDVLPYTGAVKLTFTKEIDLDNKETEIYVLAKPTSSSTAKFKEIPVEDKILGTDKTNVYIKLQKDIPYSSVAKVWYKVFSTEYEDSDTNFKINATSKEKENLTGENNALIDCIEFRTSDSLKLVSTNLYSDKENVYYSSLTTSDFTNGGKVFKTTSDIEVTFDSAIDTTDVVKVELYKKSDVTSLSTVNEILEKDLVTSFVANGKKLTIKHKDLELSTDYELAIKVTSDDGYVRFNTRSDIWAALYAVNKDNSANTPAAKDGEYENVVLAENKIEAKDANSYYIYFKTAAKAELKLSSASFYNKKHAYETTEKTVEYKYIASDELAADKTIELVFEKSPYGTLPKAAIAADDKNLYSVSLVASKGADLDKANLVKDITVDAENNKLTIKHEKLDANALYYLSLVVYADKEHSEVLFSTKAADANFEGKENAIVDDDFITVATNPKWQFISANIYNYGVDNADYLKKDVAVSDAALLYNGKIEFVFRDEISLDGTVVDAQLYSQTFVGKKSWDETTVLSLKDVSDFSIIDSDDVKANGNKLIVTPSVDLEPGVEYYLILKVSDKKDPAIVYFDSTADNVSDYAIKAKGTDGTDYTLAAYSNDAEFTKEGAFKFTVKADNFVLTNTNLVKQDEDHNIYYTLNATTASTSRGFLVNDDITLTFAEDLPADVTYEAELYPANIITDLATTAQSGKTAEFKHRNVVTSVTHSGNVLTIKHEELIPATRYALAVKVSAKGYVDLNTKTKSVKFFEEDTDGDGNNDYWLTDSYAVFGEDIDNSATTRVNYITFDTEDGLCAVYGKDLEDKDIYATNFKLDGSTTNFKATDDIVIELNKKIDSANVSVYWGDTKEKALEKDAKFETTQSAKTYSSATLSNDKNDTTTVLRFQASGKALVPGYFYNVVIEKDDYDPLSYVFQVADDFVLGTATTDPTPTVINTGAATIDADETKVSIVTTPVKYNYEHEDEYRFFYAYGKETGFDAAKAEWIAVPNASLDNLSYLNVERGTQLKKDSSKNDLVVTFAVGKELVTGLDRPWITIKGNAIYILEQWISKEGTLNYAVLAQSIVDGVAKATATIESLGTTAGSTTNISAIPDTLNPNDVLTWTVKSNIAGDPIKNVTVVDDGDFAGNVTIHEVSYNDDFTVATVKVTCNSSITTTSGTVELRITVTDYADNSVEIEVKKQ